MRAVIQRVKQASVTVEGQEVAAIGQGFLVLVGVSKEDTIKDIDYLARKIVNLRVFEDEKGKLNLSLKDISGEVLLVSNFTLYGDCRKGNRPSFAKAAPPELAEKLYLSLAEAIKAEGVPVKTGKFRAYMEISLINDGPVTLLLDSQKSF
ncbi:D-tyrosyl-tRNA(Tyr) deacylase [Thermodesulfatator indicus DSM 15286]|uniref:D-aminoacyl-tRNA deacylase n=1 Tax=Thermodesulfatator indicus (strain DSM 15286 / JCM 11887 / CIR29812) TaxID=667014 RepID=F8AAY1_THEID|nr:D-aminoacyl-tRNA deacylase [Thermodesulfatator indicus]AEH45500.1 D-tyrosyl-tRNA(Tyr) deacylase [Thermodesulfatator indicus DSM 15286]